MKKLTIIALMLLGSTSAALLTAGTSFSQQASGTSWKPNPKFIAHKDTTRRSERKRNQFQCIGTTRAGARCQRSVATDGAYCWQHEKQRGQ